MQSISHNIGKHLRRRRLQARLSQCELAEKIGCNSHTISRYEVGLRIPTIAMLKKIAKATGCELIIELQKPIP